MTDNKEFKAQYDAGVEVSGDGWLHLHRNENLLMDKSWTIDGAKELIERANIGAYPEPTSIELRQAIASLYNVSPANVFVGNGADEVLADLFTFLRDRFDSVHLLDVRFKIYDLLAERYHFSIKELPGNSFASGDIDIARWEGGLAAIDSPNAISSAMIPTETIMAMTSKANSFVIWDNVYGEFSGDDMPEQFPENLVIVRSFSKFYGLAGLRVGYCIGPEGLIGQLLAQKDAFNVNSLAQVMAVEAIRRQADFEAIANNLIANRSDMVNRLREMDFEVHEPGGNFILVRHPKFEGAGLHQALLEHKIAVRRFEGELTNDYVRIAVPPVDDIVRLVKALEEII